jgi:hypothetical protein
MYSIYLLDNEALALIVRSNNTYFFMTSIDYLLCWTVAFQQRGRVQSTPWQGWTSFT